jgi:hypothetical protein
MQVIGLDGEAAKSPHYRAYKEGWDEAYGKANMRIHRAKGPFMDIKDETFDKAAGSLARIPQDKITMSRIFMTTLWHTPSLIWKMRSLI